MTSNWVRKNKGLDKYYKPWTPEVLDILYEAFETRLENMPDSFFLDPVNYSDELSQDDSSREETVYYRRKQYCNDAYDNLEGELVYAELTKITALEKIRFVGGDMSRLPYAYNEREFVEKKAKALDILNKDMDDEMREQCKRYEKEIRDIVEQHKLLLKNKRKVHRENCKIRLQHDAILRKNFEKEWANKYIKIMK
jgi:hypothetical protein